MTITKKMAVNTALCFENLECRSSFKPPSNLEVGILTHFTLEGTISAELLAQRHLAGKCRVGAQSQICGAPT